MSVDTGIAIHPTARQAAAQAGDPATFPGPASRGRDFLTWGGLALTLFALRVAGAADPSTFIEPEPVVRDVTVTGTVFADTNGNGQRDAAEPALPNVWVTDGERIVDSAADGGYRFAFTVDEHRLVYVTLPDGLRATSPWYRLIRQDETATSYTFDFALQPDPAAAAGEWSFLVAADSQFSSAEEGALLKDDMAQITRSTGNPRFFVNCGDLNMTGWLKEWEWYTDATAALTVACHNVYGGHEGNYGTATRLKRASEHHFNLFTGPSYHSWNTGGRHFVAYNSWGGMSPAATARQEQWIRADLARLPAGHEVVVFAHTPVRLDRWRQDLRQVACFYGHWHEDNLFVQEGVPFLCVHPLRGRDWGAFTKTIRFCRFEAGRLVTELRPTGQYQRVLLINPPEGGSLAQGAIPLRVSAFDTASRVTQVQVRMAGPAELRLALEHLGQFVWGTTLDTTLLPPGEYALNVAVTDDRPEIWPEQRFAFRVAPHAPVTPRPGADWPMVHKSLRELRTTAEPLPPPLELVWAVPTGGANQWAASPIVYRGRVYTGPENANLGATASLQCYDAATGRRLWETPLPSRIRFSPAVADGRVFVQTSSGDACCVDADSGKVLWQKRLFPLTCSPVDAKCAPLAVGDRFLAFAEYGPCVTLAAATGEVLATWPRPGPGDRVYYGGPFPAGDRVFLTTLSAAFACDAASGKPIWQFDTGALTKRGVGPGVVQDGVYYVRGLMGLLAVDAESGRKLWQVDSRTAGVVPIPTLADGLVYAGGTTLLAVEARSGAVRWRYDALRAPDPSDRRQTFGGDSSPLAAGDHVYVGRDDGYLVALDRRTGECVWRFRLGLPVKSSPVVSGNMLFVCGYDGELYAFASRGK